MAATDNYCRCPKMISAGDEQPINECTNHKNIPLENIIKRKSADVTRMIATIEEELTDSDPEETKSKATVNTNGPIVVHEHSSTRSSVYSVCEEKRAPHDNGAEAPPARKTSKSNLLKEINGGYDSVKRMLQKTMSVDRSASITYTSNKVQKPPRKFLTLDGRRGSSRKSYQGDVRNDGETLSLNERKSGSTGDLASDTCSLPDKIPTTPPPKKNGKRSNSFINLMKSNLKF